MSCVHPGTPRANNTIHSIFSPIFSKLCSMPNFCAAFGCSNATHKESCRVNGVSFHKFPLADKTILQKWILNVRRANFKPTQYSFLCSDHFAPEDFEYQPFTNRRGLKKGAIPSRFCYNQAKHCVPPRNQRSGEKIYNEGFQLNNAQSASIDREINSNEAIEIHNPTLVEVFMNEKFYPPERFEALVNDVSKSSKQKSSVKTILALKQGLVAKIFLRTLKKQMLDAQIKTANAKRDYFEAKTATLLEIQNADCEESADSYTDSSTLQDIKTLQEEEISSQIEERMLQEQLQKAQMHATKCEKIYYEVKSKMSTFS